MAASHGMPGGRKGRERARGWDLQVKPAMRRNRYSVATPRILAGEGHSQTCPQAWH